jgi:ABC-type cobalamin/Fe3+-siderophores transport system ATPase subunit
MTYLRDVSITNLFGLYDHRIQLKSDSPVTIVAGPNGIGKTTLLSLTHALLSGSYGQVAKRRFDRLAVTSDSGDRLAVEPQDAPDSEAEEARLLLQLKKRGARQVEKVIRVPKPEVELELPSWIEQVGPDLFVDTRSDDLVSLTEVRRRWGRFRASHSPSRRHRFDPPEWFVAEDWATDFIETKRLDSLLARAHRRAPQRPRDRANSGAPIHYYLSAVRDVMERARFDSARIAQTRDRTFAQRFLNRASRLAVKEDEIRARYSQVESKADDLATNALLADSLETLSSQHLNPSEKRMLKLFLDDFEEKIKPLEPVSARLNELREIVNAKFLNKRVDLDYRRGIVFVAEPDEIEIDADALSSGEQHELALISRLLFDIAPGTTVLVDEPELSLHVSWQHRMLDDLSRIAELVGLRFVLATHSTAIINGRWELVEELGPIDDRPRG